MMADHETRVERDSLGEVHVPIGALYSAQTQRAVDNFPVSGLRMPRAFLRALGFIKWAAASVNGTLGLLDAEISSPIQVAALAVAEGLHDAHFPVDVFQTGSGTSTNMNANEVIAALAGKSSGSVIHPNDHVNASQSSNDVIPTAIHISAYLTVVEELLPALQELRDTIARKAEHLDNVVTTGRTHLMDAMPVQLSQVFGGWSAQIAHGIDRLHTTLPRIAQLAIGGTAVGTGINAPMDFGVRVAQALAERTGQPFCSSDDYFCSLSSQDAAVELSGQLKTVAVSLMKVANDLRWMNSGPNAGLGEVKLPALQPGSSIMPGKVNPVVPEAVTMVCAQVMGNDMTVTIAGQSGNFQLNAMLPVIAYNLLESIQLLASASRLLAHATIRGLHVNEEHMQALVERNPILVTALNPIIGYDKAAQIAKRAMAERKKVIDVAEEMTDLSREELTRLLDPRKLTEGGIQHA
jgi:fumarate hydratase, class II